jgi:undecaprenyl phosphate N,N'-diacetylbacillosamine 1-phosphate transferase
MMPKVKRPGKWFSFAKRALDLITASLSLIILSPLIAAISVAVKISSPGPVLFRQERLGKGGVPFVLYKFRTMRHKAPVMRNDDGSTFVGSKDPRLTAVGRFLRETTLDEIPQLVNVLKGEMSVVGPRPDMAEQLALYDEEMKRKLEVKPGMASLPMTLGRNSLPWRRRVELDIYYIDRRTLRFDCEIFFKSFVLMLLRKGVYYPLTEDEERPRREIDGSR